MTEKELISKLLRLWARHPISWSIALLAYFVGVTYLFASHW